MSEQPLVSARGLAKRFKLYENPNQRLVEWLTFGRAVRHTDFWALNDIDLELARGECLGVIGANGCGKSTLLKILSGALSATRGELETRGRIFALIELGTGFNRLLTGRQNIAFAGTMLGLDPEYVASRTEAIVAFAELGEYIDRPTRYYSSGMFARLGFALFAFLEPDVLMIDEVFAVGDESFRAKCTRRLEAMVGDEGRSIILVSHSLAMVGNLCDRAMWIETGRTRMEGDTKSVTATYAATARPAEKAATPAAVASSRAEPIDIPDTCLYRAGTDGDAGPATLEAIWLTDQHGGIVACVPAHRPFSIWCAVRFKSNASTPSFGIRVEADDGDLVAESSTSALGIQVSPIDAGRGVIVQWPWRGLGVGPGEYQISFFAGLTGESASLQWPRICKMPIEGDAIVESRFNVFLMPNIHLAQGE